MPNYYYFIALAGLCSFFTHAFTSDFQGSAFWFKNLLEIISGLGFLSFFVLLVILLFKTTWWHPLLIFAAVSAVAGLLSPLGKNVFIASISAVAIVVLNFMAWTAIF